MQSLHLISEFEFEKQTSQHAGAIDHDHLTCQDSGLLRFILTEKKMVPGNHLSSLNWQQYPNLPPQTLALRPFIEEFGTTKEYFSLILYGRIFENANLLIKRLSFFILQR